MSPTVWSNLRPSSIVCKKERAKKINITLNLLGECSIIQVCTYRHMYVCKDSCLRPRLDDNGQMQIWNSSPCCIQIFRVTFKFPFGELLTLLHGGQRRIYSNIEWRELSLSWTTTTTTTIPTWMVTMIPSRRGLHVDLLYLCRCYVFPL